LFCLEFVASSTLIVVLVFFLLSVFLDGCQAIRAEFDQAKAGMRHAKHLHARVLLDSLPTTIAKKIDLINRKFKLHPMQKYQPISD